MFLCLLIGALMVPAVKKLLVFIDGMLRDRYVVVVRTSSGGDNVSAGWGPSSSATTPSSPVRIQPLEICTQKVDVSVQTWENDLWRETMPTLRAIGKAFRLLKYYELRKADLVAELVPLIELHGMPQGYESKDSLRKVY